MEKKDFFKLDLYSIIGVDELASDKEILTGYRKRALKCHPDKNPDNLKAAEEFHQLSKALEVLTDAAARAAYDQSRKAKKAALERTRALDTKRKKFKEDLEAREQAVFEQTERVKEQQAEKKLRAEVERLRQEGSRLLEQEQERLREELRKYSKTTQDLSTQESTQQQNRDPPRIKLKWKAHKSDSRNGGYDSAKLSDILSCYGKVSTLIMSSKRNGSAIVEFENMPGVSPDILDEMGLAENPFLMIWLSGKPSKTEVSFQTFQTSNSFDNANENSCAVKPSAFQSTGSGVNFESGNNSSGVFNVETIADSSCKDFESVVLRNMRLAEERKKLIQQMMTEDAEGD